FANCGKDWGQSPNSGPRCAISSVSSFLIPWKPYTDIWLLFIVCKLNDSRIENCCNLTQNISMLRKLLGESPDDPQYIETVPRRGYRFVADVKEVAEEGLDAVIQQLPKSESLNEQKHRASLIAAPPLSKVRRHKQGALLFSATLMIVIAGAAFGPRKLIGLNRPTAPLTAMTVIRLTHTGKAARAAISPDGKYVAHVIEESGKQSLWLRQV